MVRVQISCSIALRVLSVRPRAISVLTSVLPFSFVFAKVDATEGDPMSGDDAYDMIRYGLMSRPSITDKTVIRHAVGSPGWYNEQANDIFTPTNQPLDEHLNRHRKLALSICR